MLLVFGRYIILATRMAGRIRRIDVLDPTLETRTSYKERLDTIFLANDIKDEKKNSGAIEHRGSKNVRTVKRLESP